MEKNSLNFSPEKASALLNRWREKPATFLSSVLGVKSIWKMQQEVLDACPKAIATGKHIYIGSGHSLGKDYICAAIGLWFLHAYKPSIVVETAPTDRQVKKVMYGETLAHWNNRKMDLGGKAFANPYIEFQKDKWYMIGFTTKETGASKDAAGGKFQGFHSPNICVIVSEAQAVEDNIYDQIDGIATSENVLVIFIGNPTRAKGRFAKGLRDKVNNIVFNFSCLENPNYIHQKVMIPGLTSYRWVEDKRQKWGVDDPRWFGRVLGQIPETAVSTVLGQRDINLMIGRHGTLSHYGDDAGVSVDPSGEGVDENVFKAGKNGEVLETYKQTNMAPSVAAIHAVEMCKRIHGHFIIVDCDGVGIGVWQELNKLSQDYLEGIQIIKFHGSGKSEVEEDGRQVYQNQRAEAAFVSQKRARQGKAAIDPKDKETIEDLMEEEYFTNNRGYIQIEGKDDIKERLERSPGCGDAFKMLQWGFEQGYRRSNMYKTIDRQGHGTPIMPIEEPATMGGYHGV